MSVILIRTERASRSSRMLRTALGSAISGWLDDPVVIEVVLNPDGRLWIDRLGEGIADTGVEMAAADGERIIRLVAHHVGVEVHGSAVAVMPPCRPALASPSEGARQKWRILQQI